MLYKSMVGGKALTLCVFNMDGSASSSYMSRVDGMASTCFFRRVGFFRAMSNFCHKCSMWLGGLQHHTFQGWVGDLQCWCQGWVGEFQCHLPSV